MAYDNLVLGELRPIREKELENILAWRNAPSVRVNMFTQHEISLAEHLSWWKKIGGNDNQKYFMYEYQADALGVVAFTDISHLNNNSFWAFYAAPNSPKGTGSKMEFLALDYAFLNLKLNKLCCEVLSYNQTVIKLHKKFGFNVEGVLRKQHKINNEFIDVYVLGILAAEWHVKRKDMLNKLIKISRV